MPNIAIHRCTLRIVRHGGWSWGPEPRKLLQTAIKALPELLARELGELWPDDVELEFASPISLSVPLTMGDLLAAASEGPPLNSTQASPLVQVLGERIGQAARKAFFREQQIAFASRPDPQDQSREDQGSRFPDRRTDPSDRGTDFSDRRIDFSDRRVDFSDRGTDFAAGGDAGSAVLEVLRSWHRAGVLSRRLAAFSRMALEAWLDRLVQPARYRDNRDQSLPVDPESAGQREIESLVGDCALSVTPQVIERVVGDSLRPVQNTPPDREAILRRRLMVLTEAMIQLGLPQCTPALLVALERALPFDRSGGSESVDLASTLPGNGREQTVSPMKTEQLATVTPRERPGPESDDQSQGRFSGPESIHAKRAREQSPLPGNERDAWDPSLTAGARPTKETNSSLAEFSSGAADPEKGRRAANRGLGPILARAVPQSAGRSLLRGETHSGLSQPLLTSRPLNLPGQWKTHHVASALPFLLLGPLSGLGYLKALAATMEAANAVAALPLFAAALAYKVLEPPARGWRRGPDSIAAATVFAGLNQPAAEPALVQLAEELRHHLSPLDATLSGALISGHNRQQPLLLLRTGTMAESGFLLLDVEGMFPIQWAARAADLGQVLIQLDSSIVVIPQESAEPNLLRWLDEEGFRFVTDAIPTRGEHWRALRRSSSERWWTNEAIMPDSAIIKLARTLSHAAAEAETSWQALAVQRPGIPLASDSRLEGHLTLAASVALGSVAWELWRDRELTTPYLALERFYDLEAQVTRMRDVVQVSLPLGKRFQDLRVHGMLDDIADVPWFNGRVLKFSSN